MPTIRVLAWPAYGNEHSNPYNALLYNAMQNSSGAQAQREQIRVQEFSLARLFTSRIDVLHLHWPELFLNSNYYFKALFGSIALLFGISVRRLFGTRLVWTVHNLEPHRIRFPRTSCWFWRHFIRKVDGICSLSAANESLVLARYPKLSTIKRTVTYHPLYPVEASALSKVEARQRLQLPTDDTKVFICLGQIKAYKGYDALLAVFQTLEHCQLIIAGKCRDAEYLQQLQAQVQGKNHIEIRPGFVADADLPLYFAAADYSIIPFQTIFNSGSALMSVSFNVSVVLPTTANFIEYNQLLDQRFKLYEGALSAAFIRSLLATKVQTKTPHVDALLTWPVAADRTKALYRALLADK